MAQAQKELIWYYEIIWSQFGVDPPKSMVRFFAETMELCIYIQRIEGQYT